MSILIRVTTLVLILAVALLLGVVRVDAQRVRWQIGAVGFPISDNYKHTMGYDVWLYLLFVALIVGVRWAKPRPDAGSGKQSTNGNSREWT